MISGFSLSPQKNGKRHNLIKAEVKRQKKKQKSEGTGKRLVFIFPFTDLRPLASFLISLYSVRRMLRRLLGFLWRKAPKAVRRWGVRFTQPRFQVTAGAVVLNNEGRVLLLKHVFRPGSGWGIPGGFLEKGEQPDEAVRRELREETGLELESVEIAFIRALEKSNRVEIIYRCRAHGQLSLQGYEIKSGDWFQPDQLPQELGQDQRWIIRTVLGDE